MKIKIPCMNFILDIFFLISAISMLFLPNETGYLPWFGFLLIPLSFHMLYKCQENRFLAYLLVIIFLVNFSISVNDFILMGEHISVWQSIKMRASFYNLIMAKSLLSFTATLNLFLNGNVCNKQTEINDIYEARVNNLLVRFGCLIGLIGILLYGIIFELSTHTEGYSSVSNPIYEYSIIIYVLAWFTSKNSYIFKKILLLYACVFMLVFFCIGDRSSASMYMIFLLISRYKRKINVTSLCLIGIIGIIFFNIIAIIRTTYDFSFSALINQLITRGIYSDTASWAYYSSITVVAAGLDYKHPVEMIVGFLSSIIGIKNEFGNLAVFANVYDSNNFFNRGGALFPSYFTAWFGGIGGIIAGLVLGFIIRKLFKKNRGIGLYYKLLILVFVVRWYVYTPYVLFRSVFFIGGIVYVAYWCFTTLLRTNRSRGY